MDSAGTLIFLAVAVIVVALAIFGAMQAKKRRQELLLLAQRLGLRFSTEHDRELPSAYSFLNRLQQGTNRYAFNILEGVYEGHEIRAFDFHYETHSTDSKGHRQTHHHYFSFLVLSLPANFPELTIASEGLLSKLAQAVGYDDIDFESHEFSRNFVVRSTDKKFAYDICHARMIEYLLANRDLAVEIEGHALAFAFGTRLAAAELEQNLQRLVQVRSLLPNYLFSVRS